jgi:SPP1 gp7 family putative phage head morphogenesis protein
MRFNLAALIQRLRRPRRKQIPIRAITPSGVLATDLFRAAYLPIVEAWEQAQARIVGAYERTLAEMTTDSAPELGDEIDLTDAAIIALMPALALAVTRWAIRLEEWHRRRWVASVSSSAGVDIAPILAADPPAVLRTPQAAVRAVPAARSVSAARAARATPGLAPATVRNALELTIQRNVALIKDISDQARARIADAVYRGAQNRTSARELASEIAEATEMARKRALRVASHQLSAASAALDGDRRREAGIDTFMWHHSRKQNFRPDHKSWDGKIFTEANPPPDRAGEKPGCGCRERAVVEFD